MQLFVIYCCFHILLFFVFSISYWPRAGRPRSQWLRMGGAGWGERVYAEGKMKRGKSWGNAEEARGNKNPAKPWGLRDENCILLNEDCQS